MDANNGGFTLAARSGANTAMPSNYGAVIEELQARIDQLEQNNAFLLDIADAKSAETTRYNRDMDRLQAELWQCRERLNERRGLPLNTDNTSEYGPYIYNQPFWHRLVEAEQPASTMQPTTEATPATPLCENNENLDENLVQNDASVATAQPTLESPVHSDDVVEFQMNELSANKKMKKTPKKSSWLCVFHACIRRTEAD